MKQRSNGGKAGKEFSQHGHVGKMKVTEYLSLSSGGTAMSFRLTKGITGTEVRGMHN
jgi:hypothetical protein